MAVLVQGSAEITNALQYVQADFMTRIYDRNKNEFTSCMTETVNFIFNRINNILREKQ
ncbi:hypothetical protein [Candidatus Williamhamiltonella defendens]|uniref:hypothetical protein n=1 Tax=Candidatus Williamhamiltonella defendens TaxID=138072 RepID=UPI001650D616|nr:hypothetical protein [Candidatus Hamiltonella defensa]